MADEKEVACGRFSYGGDGPSEGPACEDRTEDETDELEGTVGICG